MPFGLGPVELLIILVIIVLIFGANRLGEIGGALGKTVREFRHELKDDDPANPAAKPGDPKAATAPAAAAPVQSADAKPEEEKKA